MISIHVPAWGTTESDAYPKLITKFQSTFPRGERPPGNEATEDPNDYFNPRSRVGNDDGCLVRMELET